MLYLVFPDRNPIGLVQQDVGKRDGRIVEQSGHHAFLLRRLVLVLRLSFELADRRQRIQDPGKLGMLRNGRLNEQRRLLRIDAGGKERERHVTTTLAELRRIIAGDDRVIIQHHEDRLGLVLPPCPVLHRAEVVSDVELTGRLDSTEDSGHRKNLVMTITDRERRDLLATCVAAAAKGAEVIRAGAAKREQLTWETKSQSDFVSEVDRDSERVLAEVIRGRHPDAGLVAEEGSPQITSLAGLHFIADPLDGTTNFLHGFPWYAVSIAAVVDGELQAGVVLNAATGELFTATAGGGARCAGQPATVSKITEPNRALIGTGFPFVSEERVTRYLEID